MNITWEYGPLDFDLEAVVNRRLKDGWYLLQHAAIYHPPDAALPSRPHAVFMFCDEVPSRNWYGADDDDAGRAADVDGRLDSLAQLVKRLVDDLGGENLSISVSLPSVPEEPPDAVDAVD